MKKFFVAMSALCLFAAIGSNAMAGEKKMKAGVDAGVVVPISSTWSDGAGMNVGALGVFEYQLDAKMTVTGRVGYLHGLAKDVSGIDSSLTMIPIYAGIKYYVMPNFYAAGEAGLTMMTFKAEGKFMGVSFDSSADETKLGLTAGVGYEMGNLDFRGNLLFPSIGDLGDYMGLMVTAGYRFGL
jgi:hypothetical protein